MVEQQYMAETVSGAYCPSLSPGAPNVPWLSRDSLMDAFVLRRRLLEGKLDTTSFSLNLQTFRRPILSETLF